jgi:uncharacterized protein YceK
MRRGAAICLAAAVACAQSGCGTANNLVVPAKDGKGKVTGPPPGQVFGGVAVDARVGTSWMAAPFVEELGPEVPTWERALETACKVGIGAYVLGVDLPLSAVADTVTLPVTVSATLKKQERSAGNAEKKGSEAGAPADDDSEKD